MQGAPLVDLERADQRQAEKLLVEYPRLFDVKLRRRCDAIAADSAVDIGARLREV